MVLLLSLMLLCVLNSWGIRVMGSLGVIVLLVFMLNMFFSIIER